jgi:hypothetical protein
MCAEGMKNTRPFTAEEENVFRDFIDTMNQVTVPQIVETYYKRQLLAKESARQIIRT